MVKTVKLKAVIAAILSGNMIAVNDFYPLLVPEINEISV